MSDTYVVYTAYFDPYWDPFGPERSVTLFAIEPFKDGFWVTEDFKYTYDQDDMMYWVPPHAIKYVKKEVRELK